MTTIKDAKAFLTEWRSGYYEHTKLANVLFAYELQRRLGGRWVTECWVLGWSGDGVLSADMTSEC